MSWPRTGLWRAMLRHGRGRDEARPSIHKCRLIRSIIRIAVAQFGTQTLTPAQAVTILPTLNMTLSVSIPVGQAECLGELVCTDCAKPLADQDISAALRNPLWPDNRDQTVFDRIQPGESVCLVVSDQTRKTAAHRILPVLLRGLQERACGKAPKSTVRRPCPRGCAARA